MRAHRSYGPATHGAYSNPPQRRQKSTQAHPPGPVAPAKVPLELTENKPDFTQSFPGYLTSMVASMLVEGNGHVALRMLAQIGWWTAEEHHVDLKLAQYMRRTLTTAYGSTIHYTNREDLIDEYVAVVRDLLAGRLLTGRPMAANNAYYLIKHSEPTRGKHDVRVRPVFHSLLDRIGGRPPRTDAPIGTRRRDTDPSKPGPCSGHPHPIARSSQARGQRYGVQGGLHIDAFPVT